MAAQQSFFRRWEDYRASKSVLFWSCAGCAVATAIVGFAWGGWVTGGTAGQMVTNATTEARAELAAGICVERFAKGPDATAQLASLKATDSWNQDKFIEDGGWVTLPGTENPIAGAAALCARQLIDAKAPAKAASASG
jgi:hypothetical protein